MPAMRFKVEAGIISPTTQGFAMTYMTRDLERKNVRIQREGVVQLQE
jgi:hypothetical protein